MFKRLGVDPLVIELDEMGKFLQTQVLLPVHLLFKLYDFMIWGKNVYFVLELYFLLNVN